jgi:hypothetical protein
MSETNERVWEMRRKLNFREVPEPQTCSNCEHAKGSVKRGEGYDECEETGAVLSWHLMKKTVCDCWKAKHVPTARDTALAKLTAADRRALGL